MRANEFQNDRWKVTLTYQKIDTPRIVPSRDNEEGAAAFKRGDYSTAFNKWRPLAGQGSSDARYWMGVMYKDGLYVSQDFETALRWFTLAAEQGDD